MATNYFIIRNSSDPKVVGIKNGGSQVQIYREGFSDKSNYDRYYEFFADRSSDVWSRSDKMPDFEFSLEYVRPEKGAKLTDFLSYYPMALRGILVSEKVIQVLEQFNLPPFKKYIAKVYIGDSNFVPYFFIHLPTLSYESISFRNIIFYKGDELTGKEYFQINTTQEFEEIRSKSAFSVEQLVLAKDFDKNLDLFTTKMTPDFIVSSRLKEKIVEAKLTGVNLIEAYGQRQMSIKIEG